MAIGFWVYVVYEEHRHYAGLLYIGMGATSILLMGLIVLRRVGLRQRSST
jgi:hypothetical protein